MTLPPLFLSVAAAGSLLVLAGCVGGGSSQTAIVDKYSTACIFETNAKGSYVYSSGDSEVKAGGGGTAGDAAAINACIRRKAAEAGTPLVASAPGQTTEIEVVGGSVTETFTYGQPPAAATLPTSRTPKPENCRVRNVMSGGSGYHQCVR
jgi:hypothetical protein